MLNELTYKKFGAYAILIEWRSLIDEEILEDILLFKRKIILQKESDFVDIVQGYNSLTIVYKNLNFNFNEEVSFLKRIYSSNLTEKHQYFFQWEIPVCYHAKFGVDLQEIANQKERSIDSIIHLHSKTVYRIYFIGFLPGFLYLGGLHEALHVNRKSNPRLHVPKGAVAIGGKQTGVYPNNSAGGWNIIGSTPINFFNIDNKNICFAKPGDFIKFKPICLNEFYRIEKETKENTYQIIKTQHNA